MSSLASVPKEIIRSAERGELQKVVKWLRKGGSVGATFPQPDAHGDISAFTLLHIRNRESPARWLAPPFRLESLERACACGVHASHAWPCASCS